jgi:hypothetical protein
MYALPGGYGRDLCVYTFCPLLFTLSPERREGSTIERLPHERGGANDERKKKKCIQGKKERAREPFAFASIERPAPVHIPLSHPPPYIMGREGEGNI